MGKLNHFIISENFLEEIFKQAVTEYPSECCGMLMGPKGEEGEIERIRPCENAQNRFHELDSSVFPRTAETAYFIDPKELLAIERENRENNQEIRVIYHSHINAGAYFSEEDVKMALCEGVPAYPDVQYLVVSVVNGKIDDHKLYLWDNEKKEFCA